MSSSKPIVCVCRLRERVRYLRPLEHIQDCVYEVLGKFVRRHPEYRYTYYNITFDGTPPRRDVGAVAKADVILVISDHEFHYHVPGYFHSLELAKSHRFVQEVEPHMAGKKLLLMRCDRGDTEAVYREHTFPNVDFSYGEIDEVEFPTGNIGGMRWHFIRARLSSTAGLLGDSSPKKGLDFCYWGSPKNKLPGGVPSGDLRHKVLKDISKSDLACFWIGRYTNIKPQLKMMPLGEILPYICSARATLCFNWLDPRATTARYQEACACGVVPFAWGGYDSDSKLVKLPWQRVGEAAEFVARVKELRDAAVFRDRLQEVCANFSVPPVEDYYKCFEKLLLRQLQG